MKATREELFDFLLARLNANTQGVTFAGNFVFKFWSQPKDVQDFAIIQSNPDQLENFEQVVVPFVEASAVEIPFAQKVPKSEWDAEYYIAVRINDRIVNKQIVFDFDGNDPTYQAMLETVNQLRIDNLNGIIKDGFRLGVKVREPQRVNVFKHNAGYYQLFSIAMNLAKMTGNAILGQDLTITLDGNEIDVVQASFGYGVDTSPDMKLKTDNIQRTRPNSHVWTLELVVNHNGTLIDNLIERHGHRLEPVRRTYTVNVVTKAVSYTKTVYIMNVGHAWKINGQVQLAFKLEEAA